MFQLILVSRGLAPLQVTNCIMKKRKLPLQVAMNLVYHDHPVVYETEDNQDALDFKQQLEKYGATVELATIKVKASPEMEESLPDVSPAASQSLLSDFAKSLEFKSALELAKIYSDTIDNYNEFLALLKKQQDFIQSKEFEQLSESERYFYENKCHHLAGYVKCLGLEYLQVKVAYVKSLSKDIIQKSTEGLHL